MWIRFVQTQVLTVSSFNTCLRLYSQCMQARRTRPYGVPVTLFPFISKPEHIGSSYYEITMPYFTKIRPAAVELLHSKLWVTRPNVAKRTVNVLLGRCQEMNETFHSRSRPFYSHLTKIVVSLSVENFV
jgi:hypothetical protein